MSRRKSKRRVKQSKPKKQTQPETQIEVFTPPEVAEELVTYQGADFNDVENHEIGQADERQLKLLIRDWRHGRATRTFWDVLTSSYNTLFSVLVIGAMVIGGITGAQQSSAGCVTPGCQTAQTWLPWLLVALAGLLAVSIAKLFGPVLASTAEGFWLFSAPIRRSVWLRPRLARDLVLAFLVASVISFVVNLLIGSPYLIAAWWALAAAAMATAGVALVAAAQRNPTQRVANLAQTLLSVITVVIMILLVAVSVQWLQITAEPTVQVAAIITIVAAVIGLLLAAIAFNRLSTLPRTKLTSGSELANAMQGAAFALDFNLMRDILTQRKYREIGHVNPAGGRSIGIAALAWRDVQRLVRNPARVIVIVLTVILPYATQSLGLGIWGSLLTSIILMFVFIPSFDALRVLSRHKGLARTLPFSTEEIRTATTAVPALIALVWAVLTASAFMIGVDDYSLRSMLHAVAMALITSGAGFLGAMRWVSSKAPDYSQPLMSTNAGAIPPQLLFNLFRGFDVILILILPLVFGLPAWIVVLALAVFYWFMRQGKNMSREEMLEASMEARKEAEQLKTQQGYGAASSEKKVVSRSKRA